MKILSVKFNVKPKDVAVKHSAHSANIGPVTTLITEELSKENWAFGGGAAAGYSGAQRCEGRVGAELRKADRRGHQLLLIGWQTPYTACGAAGNHGTEFGD